MQRFLSRILRSVGPDVLLVLGLGGALVGAYLLSPYAALLLVGISLVLLAIWMGA